MSYGSYTDTYIHAMQATANSVSESAHPMPFWIVDLHNQRAEWLTAQLLLKENQRMIVMAAPWYLSLGLNHAGCRTVFDGLPAPAIKPNRAP